MSMTAIAKDWRGIIPLHSTRADVERLLGKPNDGTYYNFKDDRIEINYVERACESTGPLPGFNVPVGTVSQITVFHKKERRKSELHIDESKFSKTKESDTDWQYYANHEEGIMYLIYEPEGDTNGIVGTTIYFASDSDEYLRCSKKSKPLSYRHAPPNNSFDRSANSTAFIRKD